MDDYESVLDKHMVVTVTTYGVRKSRKTRSGKENKSPSSSLSITKVNVMFVVVHSGQTSQVRREPISLVGPASCKSGVCGRAYS